VRRTWIFYAIAALLCAALLELSAAGTLYAYSNSRGTLFNVSAFAEIVNDARMVTLRKNYDGSQHGGWRVITNGSRARIPPGAAGEERPQGAEDGPIFLFIGDSVPFGWGVSAEQSIPYFLSRQYSRWQVINGAFPSYSLKQAVARFEIEFSRKANLRYVYVQIYDPVSQYVELGREWTEDDNWTTNPKRTRSVSLIPRIEVPFYGEPFVTMLLFRIERRIRPMQPPWISPTAESEKRFREHVERQVLLLNSMVTGAGARLIVAPATVPPYEWLRLPAPYRETIDLLNRELQAAADKAGAIFLDTRRLFDAASTGDFIDDCCHLSASGALKVGAAIGAQIQDRR
jgi:hypothetical protein